MAVRGRKSHYDVEKRHERKKRASKNPLLAKRLSRPAVKKVSQFSLFFKEYSLATKGESDLTFDQVEEVLESLSLTDLSSKKTSQQDCMDSWELMTSDSSNATIPEKSLLLFISSVLGFYDDFIKLVLKPENMEQDNVKECRSEMQKIYEEFGNLRVNRTGKLDESRQSISTGRLSFRSNDSDVPRLLYKVEKPKRLNPTEGPKVPPSMKRRLAKNSIITL